MVSKKPIAGPLQLPVKCRKSGCPFEGKLIVINVRDYTEKRTVRCPGCQTPPEMDKRTLQKCLTMISREIGRLADERDKPAQ